MPSPKYLFMEETSKRSFTVIDNETKTAMLKSYDYAKPDGIGFDQGDYDLAKSRARELVTLANKAHREIAQKAALDAGGFMD